MTALLPSGSAATNAGVALPASEAARDRLAEKLHAVQQQKSPVNTNATSSGSSLPPSAIPSSSASESALAASNTRPPSEANPAPTQSSATGIPLPPLKLLPAPSALGSEALSKMSFSVPRKRIVSPRSMQRWQTSQTFDEVLGFVMACNEAVVGRKLTDDIEESAAVQSILAVLQRVHEVVQQTPAEQGSSSRFGNPAFRTFYARVKEQSRALHSSIPGLEEIKGSGSANTTDAIGEIETYFIECFGNEKRIDYGSGMELNFACWLLCLVKLGVVQMSEAPALVLRVFWRYVEVMREIQSTYWLEPAGSHGVWGLDDYHFLPFLFGSAQLKGHKIFRPKSIHDDDILDDFSKDYMYFACIRFINSIKTASLRWHSPMLDDISGVKTWAKVNEGMLKMYKAEVLLKLPIAQHIFFGQLLSFPAADTPSDEEEEALQEAVQQGGVVHSDEHGNTHVHAPGGSAMNDDGSSAAASANGWGDCCGIPIPSAFAAAQEEREKLRGAGNLRFEGGSGVRRIPFD